MDKVTCARSYIWLNPQKFNGTLFTLSFHTTKNYFFIYLAALFRPIMILNPFNMLQSNLVGTFINLTRYFWKSIKNCRDRQLDPLGNMVLYLIIWYSFIKWFALGSRPELHWWPNYSEFWSCRKIFKCVFRGVARIWISILVRIKNLNSCS